MIHCTAFKGDIVDSTRGAKCAEGEKVVQQVSSLGKTMPLAWPFKFNEQAAHAQYASDTWTLLSVAENPRGKPHTKKHIPKHAFIGSVNENCAWVGLSWDIRWTSEAWFAATDMPFPWGGAKRWRPGRIRFIRTRVFHGRGCGGAFPRAFRCM